MHIMENSITIDSVDVVILKNLMADARTSYSDIAKECGISTFAIVQRVKKLKEAGIIKGSGLRVNPQKLGYKYNMVIGISIVSEQEEKMLEFLSKQKIVYLFYAQLGKFDIYCAFRAKSLEEINHFIQEVRNRPGVIETSNSLLIDEYYTDITNLDIKTRG
jgi:Lrp/AsnC family transcriptional regulator for asnA, asnC and gidA